LLIKTISSILILQNNFKLLFSKTTVEVTMIALKKKPQAIKCRNRHTISLIAHTVKIVAKIFRRRFGIKIEDVRRDQFGFTRGKRTRDAIVMLRIISEQTLEMMRRCVFAS
jgi:hypothetical protein